MPTLPVHFRPRAPWGTLGTEWMPHGLDSRPFHLDFERVPPEATERREFQCSTTLESYLVEFYHEILPKFPFPSLAGSPDFCALLASHNSNDVYSVRYSIWVFKWRVTRAMLAWLAALPEDATAQVVLGPPLGQGDEERLAMQLSQATMLSMRDDLIELRVWASIFTEIDDYFRELLMLLACC
ncbi:hypothetical protein B0H16DRAFT_1736860 [Mycena metata]|uniref:Uncharacterized protein n=1 Tax=Mycena metata TaxID=1033252 RepID=A0AAD7MMI8_9AGAR|nr:hypothetical protein B0H16DRAFT_1736860 [Mycena metata]